jgi:hypothetical protein
MAKFVVKDPVVVLNGGTVSANVAQATIALEADDVETTNFAGNGWRERIGGLKLPAFRSTSIRTLAVVASIASSIRYWVGLLRWKSFRPQAPQSVQQTRVFVQRQSSEYSPWTQPWAISRHFP